MKADIEYGLLLKVNDTATNTLKTVGKSVSGLGGMFAGLASKITPIAATVYLVEKAFSILVKVLKAAPKAAMESENAIASLNAALKNQGNYSIKASKELQDYATSLQKVTKYNDEAIIGAETMLVSLAGLSGKGLKDATKATLDLAAGMNMDLGSASKLVAKSLTNDMNMLQRYGIAAKGAGGSTERFSTLLDGISAKFGGRAVADANTLTGSFAKMGNQYDDLLEKIGKTPTEFMKPFVDIIGGALAKINEHWDEIILSVGLFMINVKTILKKDGEMLISILMEPFKVSNYTAVIGVFYDYIKDSAKLSLNILKGLGKKALEMHKEEYIKKQEAATTLQERLGKIDLEGHNQKLALINKSKQKLKESDDDTNNNNKNNAKAVKDLTDKTYQELMKTHDTYAKTLIGSKDKILLAEIANLEKINRAKKLSLGQTAEIDAQITQKSNELTLEYSSKNLKDFKDGIALQKAASEMSIEDEITLYEEMISTKILNEEDLANTQNELAMLRAEKEGKAYSERKELAKKFFDDVIAMQISQTETGKQINEDYKKSMQEVDKDYSRSKEDLQEEFNNTEFATMEEKRDAQKKLNDSINKLDKDLVRKKQDLLDKKHEAEKKNNDMIKELYKKTAIDFLMVEAAKATAWFAGRIAAAIASKDWGGAALAGVEAGVAATAFSSGISAIQGLESGGIVAGNGIYRMGEGDKKEAVIPLESGSGQKALANAFGGVTGNSSQNITLQIDGRTLAEIVTNHQVGGRKQGRF